MTREDKILDRLADLFETVVEYLEKDMAEKYIEMWNKEIHNFHEKYVITSREE